MLLNDLNILNAFDELTEVYILNSWSFCCEGLLAVSNVRANLQLSGPGTRCSNVRNHSPAHVEVLPHGCWSNTSSAANVNVKERRKVMGLTWTKRSSAVSQPALYGCHTGHSLSHFIPVLGLLISLRESLLLSFTLNGSTDPVQHSSCLGMDAKVEVGQLSFKQI